MSLITREQLIERLNWRYATKEFDPARKIGAEDWATLEEVLLLAPSGLNLQPWKFVVVTDPAVKQQLVPASYGQTQPVTASHLVVLAARVPYGVAELDQQVRRTAEVRGVAVEDLGGYRSMSIEAVIEGRDDAARRIWIDNQIHIALGYLLTSAALLGIDACPMGGFIAEEYDRILGLKEQGLASVVVAALGYRAASDRNAGLKKVRLRREDLLIHV
jgi:nitroreductase